MLQKCYEVLHRESEVIGSWIVKYHHEIYCKASSKGAYGHYPFLSVFEEHLIPQQQMLQRHYLYYR